MGRHVPRFLAISKLNSLNPQQKLTYTRLKIDEFNPGPYPTLFPQLGAEHGLFAMVEKLFAGPRL